MKNKLVAILLLTLAGAGNAFAAKSATAPLNGSYTNHQVFSCTADVASQIPATYASSYTNHQVGVVTFTPDTTSYPGTTSLQGLSGWLATAPLRGFPNPILMFTSNQDPTAPAGTMLNETPIEWGTQLLVSANADLTSPYATLPSFYVGPETSYFIVTTFKYAFPTNNGNVQTGYAAYSIKAGKTGWGRTQIYSANITTTARLISASFSNKFNNSLTFSPDPRSYNFDCLASGIITQ